MVSRVCIPTRERGNEKHILNIYKEQELEKKASLRKIGNSDFSTKDYGDSLLNIRNIRTFYYEIHPLSYLVYCHRNLDVKRRSLGNKM